MQREVRTDVYACVCDCGNGPVEIWRGCLTKVGITNCGCTYPLSPSYGFHVRYYRTRKGKSRAKGSPEFWSFKNAKERCLIPGIPSWEHYGGRGIKFCDRWLIAGGMGFRNFLADMGPRPVGMTLDRIDPFKDYTPENCRWADNKEQTANRRMNYIEVDGEMKRKDELSELDRELLGIDVF